MASEIEPQLNPDGEIQSDDEAEYIKNCEKASRVHRFMHTFRERRKQWQKKRTREKRNKRRRVDASFSFSDGGDKDKEEEDHRDSNSSSGSSSEKDPKMSRSMSSEMDWDSSSKKCSYPEEEVWGSGADNNSEEEEPWDWYEKSQADAWDTDTDRDIETARSTYFDICAFEVARMHSHLPDEDLNEFIDHFLSVCESRGYDLDKASLPNGMDWDSNWWIQSYSKDDASFEDIKDIKDIVDALKEDIENIINIKRGKKLQFIGILKVNVWHRDDGHHYFITFEAREDGCLEKKTYQTRLVFRLKILNRLPQLPYRIGRGRVHAFRPHPNY